MKHKRVVSAYRHYIQPNTEGKGRSAEMRRLALGAFVASKYGKTEPSKALRWVCSYLMISIKLLREFETNKGGELGAKIATIEKGLTKHCGKAGTKYKSKAKSWLPVPGVGTQGSSWATGSHAREVRNTHTTQFGSPSRTGYAARQYDRHEQLQQQVNNLTAERTKSDQANAVSAEVARVLSQAATPSGFYPSVPPPNLAASLPMGNQQFQPRAYGDRPPPKCFTCGQIGHQARICPTTTGIPILPPMPTGVSQSHTVMSHEGNRPEIAQRYGGMHSDDAQVMMTTTSNVAVIDTTMVMMPTVVIVGNDDHDDTLPSQSNEKEQQQQPQGTIDEATSSDDIYSPTPAATVPPCKRIERSILIVLETILRLCM
jgi:hypothetical protein